ncbi:hypothetical protein RvY_00657 [Ramazzottius varieornatus]|uniref:Uncharacterized protein n=1 Tax=Ramazzottius varieornatus TaxID=947166 RepID=A0A1D1UDI8_RAMVA|nr:hypothetical protein RvY_00657 [Ramazzottius varieornatus]
MGRAEDGRRMQSREVSPPSENATSDEEEWESRASTSSIWPRGQSLTLNSSFEESFGYSESYLPHSVISEDDLPVPGRQYEQDTAQPEVHIWSAECEGKLEEA